jgi:hypothetical protein
MGETVDLKSLARLVSERDTVRDSRRDRVSRDCPDPQGPPRQYQKLYVPKTPQRDQRPPSGLGRTPTAFAGVFDALERRCPEYVEVDRWHRAVADGERFLAQWAEQARQLGWTARDLFGLHTPPDKPAPSYRRLSRYDAVGLIWLLEGREVIALTTDTAAIRWPSGSVTVYRKNNKPALGPVGDSLDDFQGSR